MKKIPVMTMVIVTMIVLTLSFLMYVGRKSRDYESMTSRQLAQRCLPSEGDVMHIHPHLAIMANKQNIDIPAKIGVNEEKKCINAIHTHDPDGVIHIESPAAKDFTLGDFFAVWNKPFSKDTVLNYKTDATHALKMYVDGQEVSSFDSLILKDHQNIFIDYYDLTTGPDPVPAPFQFDENKE